MDEFLFLQCFCYACFKLNIGYGYALDATHFISIQSPHLPPLLLHAAIRFPHNLSMRTVFHTFRLTAILLACAYATVARGGDWPQFLGPHRNGAVTGETIRTNWKNQPPKKQWEQKVGSGFSGPIISDKTVFLYHRLGTQSTLDSIDLKSGERNWRYQHATQYRDDFGFDNGPRATPCVDGDSIFLMSADGMLSAVEKNSGRKRWEVDAKSTWKSGKGFFGMAPSPLAVGDVVVFIIGGQDDSGVIALNRNTGKLAWKATADEAGYASPVLENRGKDPALWVWTREKLYTMEPGSGHVLASLPWRSSMNASVNAATPLLLPEGVFVSASYGAGALLVKRKGNLLNRIWSGDDHISNHYATCVYHQGYLYGFHGRQEYGPEFRCIEAATGKVQWSEDNLSAGSVICVNDQLLLMMESGELILLEASPDAFRTLGRRQILPSGVRAFPAFSNGIFLARSPERLVCMEMSGNP